MEFSLWIYWIYGILGLINLIFIIFICVIGKRKNPNTGWDLILIWQAINILSWCFKLILIVWQIRGHFVASNPVSESLFALIHLIGMVLFLIGMYYIATNKKSEYMEDKFLRIFTQILSWTLILIGGILTLGIIYCIRMGINPPSFVGGFIVAAMVSCIPPTLLLFVSGIILFLFRKIKGKKKFQQFE